MCVMQPTACCQIKSSPHLLALPAARAADVAAAATAASCSSLLTVLTSS